MNTMQLGCTSMSFPGMMSKEMEFGILGPKKSLKANDNIILRRRVDWIMICLGHAAWEHGPCQ